MRRPRSSETLHFGHGILAVIAALTLLAAPAPAAADAGDRLSNHAQRIADYDWEWHFRQTGAVRDGLGLAISTQESSYRTGHATRLFIGVNNARTERRTLDKMPARGRLGTTQAILFRLDSDTGDAITVPNIFQVSGDGANAGPLVIAGGGRLVDYVDLDDLIAASSRVEALVGSANVLTITAEIPAYGLQSNPITLIVEVP